MQGLLVPSGPSQKTPFVRDPLRRVSQKQLCAPPVLGTPLPCPLSIYLLSLTVFASELTPSWLRGQGMRASLLVPGPRQSVGHPACLSLRHASACWPHTPRPPLRAALLPASLDLVRAEPDVVPRGKQRPPGVDRGRQVTQGAQLGVLPAHMGITGWS